MKQPNSPLPWKIDENEDYPLAIIEDNEDGMGVIEFNCDKNMRQFPERRQDAEYIVEACNNYPKAIELIQRLYETTPVGVKAWIDKLNKEVGEFLKSIE
jgi:hypothetical protein